MKFQFLLLALLAAPTIKAQQSRVFPQPASLVRTAESYTFREVIRYNTAPGIDEVLAVVADQYRLFHGITFKEVDRGTARDLSFSLQADMDEEAYGLEIGKSGIKITYGTNKGLFYALQTLDQWMGAQTGKQITLEGVKADDKPAFGYRGVHLDCSRHFFTIPEVKQFIDQAAMLKLNRFHWHLTDDQGWRIEIKRFPKLTEIGAWRDSTIIGHYSRTPREYEIEKYGGFYTQEEATEIVRYAAARGITVIPEIELPGHARAALSAYPELGCTGEQLPVPGLWGVFDDIFCSKPETVLFLQQVLEEIIAIFPSETIHVGGDEAPKLRWDACPHCKEVREANGLHDSHELQSYVIGEMGEFLQARGRKLVGWDEILEGGLAENAQVMSWRGAEGGIAAARQKHPVVMTPTSYCYLDYYQSGHPDEPLAIGGFLPLEKVYTFNPVPKELSAEEAAFILGGQGNLWTEYLREMKDVQYSAFPRLIAMAQVLWTDSLPSYPQFVKEMTAAYLPRLSTAKISYSTAYLDPSLVPTSINGGVAYQIVKPLENMWVSWYGDSITEFKLPQTSDRRVLEIELTSRMNDKALRSTYHLYVLHELLGKPVTFTTPPNPKFDHNGALAVTDGVVGKRPWKGDQWLGFDNDTVQFSIDLGRKMKISQVEMGCLNDPGSWIYRPKTIMIEASTNGKNYKLLSTTAITSEAISAMVKGKARFVRITLVNDEHIPEGQPGAGYTPWTFIDELMIR